MALLCVLKLVATTVSYASGNAGGIFAPTLYIGAMAGGAVGTIVHRLAPFPDRQNQAPTRWSAWVCSLPASSGRR